MSLMSQINLNNNEQQNLLNQLEHQLGGAGNNTVNVQQPAQQPPQADPNAAALAHLSDTDRAAAEMFLKGASVQDVTKHTKWSLATKIITGIFTFGIAPALMCRAEAIKEKQLAQDAVALKDAMNHMAKNINLKATNVLMDGKPVSVSRSDDGKITAHIGGQRIVSKFAPKVLAEIIENDIVANSDLYGKDAVHDILTSAAGVKVEKKPQSVGHPGQSLVERFETNKAKCQQRIDKATAAVNANDTARTLKSDLESAETDLKSYQENYEQEEITLNRALLESENKLGSCQKNQNLLVSTQAQGGNVDGLLKENDEKMKAAQADKEKAEAGLLRLHTQGLAQLEEKTVHRDACLLAARENPLCSELMDAQKALETLTARHTRDMEKMITRLHELEASPNRNTDAVQSEIDALKLNLSQPQNQGEATADPLKLDFNSPADALDSKGVTDTRLRELCLRTIKAEMGVDGGELHSCPTRYLNRIARYALDGYYGSARNLIDHVLKIATTNRIAGEDVMELMNVREQDRETEKKVDVAVLRPPKRSVTATATQKQVANFAADIIYSGNIVSEDRLAPEDRLRNVLQSNASVIGDIMKVEAGLHAVELDTKAQEAEAKASGPDATEVDKLMAKAARAEANAAQFEAKVLRGNNVVKAVGGFFGMLFGEAEKPDEAQFALLEARAYAAEAKHYRLLAQRSPLAERVARAQAEVEEYGDDPGRLAELTDAQRALEAFDRESRGDQTDNPLAVRVARAQAEVEEYGDDPGRLAELTDAQRALDHFNRNSAVGREAMEARFAVRLARAEAQATLSGTAADQEAADALRAAIEAARPDVPDATVGAEFDEPADTALGSRLASLDDLPADERASLLGGLPGDMRGALETMTGEMRTALLERNKAADTVSILAGITQLGAEDLREFVQKVNRSVNEVAQAVQEQMTTAILMMDATLTDPSKAVVRALKGVLEAEQLPLTRENAEAVLERKPLPGAVAAALDALASAVTGVDNPAQRRVLAGKVAVNRLEEYATLSEEDRNAQNALAEAERTLSEATKRSQRLRSSRNETTTVFMNAEEAWQAKKTEAEKAAGHAEQAETLAHTQEVTAQGLEDGFASLAGANVLLLADRAEEAEQRADSLEGVASRARVAAEEAELQLYVAGAPADAEETARTARADADKASALAEAARNEARAARTSANEAAAAVTSNDMESARAAREAALEARRQATGLRTQADEARTASNRLQDELAAARRVMDDAAAAHAKNVQDGEEAETAKMRAEAGRVKAQAAAQQAQEAARAALGTDEEGNAPVQAPAPAPANAAEAHRLRLEELRTADLDTLAASAGTDFSSDGMGKFIKFVIQDYFQSVPLMDKRAMVSAGLRYAPPNATPMQQLGAMLKGAGPVLQKIFQGLDGPGLPRDLRIACQDMKSRLAPIPPDVVESVLLDMVNSSNGRIRSIEVLSSLGAASVGEAFRCRITDHNGQPRECVVKILRPDAANRVQRERPIFERAAAKVPGMLGTFRGQMDGIMEELDFGIEAGNARAGIVYDKPFDGEERSIQCVKLAEDIPPKSNSMAMEMAPGTTLDGFLRDTREEIENLGQNLGRIETFDAQGHRTAVDYDVPDSRVNELAPAKARLQELYDQAAARHSQLTALADVWVTEGIFGEQGFFHGDLHTGNIMSDGKKLTVIDFGNATKLTQDQQCSVMTMIVATTTRQSTKFLDAFRAMLPPEAQAVFDGKRQELLERVRLIMQKGNLGDTGGRIAAILAEIQRSGVEIPHAVFNFSNSQMRLANSINEMITIMNHIAEEMRAIDKCRSIRVPEVLPIDRRMANQTLPAMADEGQTHASVLRYIDTLIAELQDEGSALNEEQKTDVHQALSFPTFILQFKVENVDRDPALLEVWNAHKAALENPKDPQHGEAVDILIGALREKALTTLNALKAEEEKDHSRQVKPDNFLDVMGDVVDTNRTTAAKKLGIGASIRYGVTSFIHDHITERVEPKI